VFEAVNDLRREEGRPCLRMAASLATAAQDHAAYMAAHHTLTHTQDPAQSGFTGESFSARGEGAGYPGARAEVVAQVGSAVRVVPLWRDSPRHLELLLLPEVTEMGVGQEAGYWCVVLGTPEGRLSRSIEPPR